MICRCAVEAVFGTKIGNHSFSPNSITKYLTHIQVP